MREEVIKTKGNILLEIVAISIVVVVLISVIAPCIAVDDNLSEVKRYSENISISGIPQPFENYALTETATLHFSYGWNAISAPVYNSTSMGSLFVGTVPGFYAVSYDNSAQMWQIEDLSQPLDPAKGYYIFATGDAEVELTGTAATYNPSLLPGWNLVGVGFYPVNLSEDQYAYWWNGSLEEYEQTHYLEPGKGYWVIDDYSPWNVPVLVIDVSPLSANISEEITVDTYGTYDVQYPLRIDCDWGDETVETEYMANETTAPVFTHSYTLSGTYTITVTATDKHGLSDTKGLPRNKLISFIITKNAHISSWMI